jgi:hypothetical protein
MAMAMHIGLAIRVPSHFLLLTVAAGVELGSCGSESSPEDLNRSSAVMPC